MKPCTLLIPLCSTVNQVLLPAGIELAEDVISSLIASRPAAGFASCRLFEYGEIRKDFVHFISHPPYQVIFADKRKNAELLRIMGAVDLPLPVLLGLDYFRIHDFHTYRHMLVIYGLSLLIAMTLIPDEKERVAKAEAGPTHDLGKIAVPLEILLKSTPLTRREREILKQHTIVGRTLLGYYYGDQDAAAAQVAGDHHEKLDGSGYPHGVTVKDQMVEIVTVCDVYDALISPRPYRVSSYDNRTALEVLTVMAEKGEVALKVVRALIALNRSDKPHFQDFILSPEKRGTPPKGNVYGMTVEGG